MHNLKWVKNTHIRYLLTIWTRTYAPTENVMLISPYIIMVLGGQIKQLKVAVIMISKWVKIEIL